MTADGGCMVDGCGCGGARVEPCGCDHASMTMCASHAGLLQLMRSMAQPLAELGDGRIRLAQLGATP